MQHVARARVTGSASKKDAMNEDHRTLTGALRAVAVDDARAAPSPWVERRLREEVRAIATRRRRARVAFALVAILMLAAVIPVWRASRRVAPAASADTAVRRAESASEVASAFLPLPYSDVPITDGQIVRLAVPRAALASFGLAPADFIDSGTVMADVIVGDDGLARAVRFVRPTRRAAPQEQKP
jgi:hypothetical protein